MFIISAINCGFLAEPRNGSKVGGKTVFPHSVQFSCDEGFDLAGSALRVCTSNGIWSGQNASCQGMYYIE